MRFEIIKVKTSIEKGNKMKTQVIWQEASLYQWFTFWWQRRSTEQIKPTHSLGSKSSNLATESDHATSSGLSTSTDGDTFE